MEEDKTFSARYPDEQPVSLRVTLRDGTSHVGACLVTKGEPSNPHTAEELAAKFFDLGEPVWGMPTTEELFSNLMRLEAIPDFREFSDLLSL